jgi:hypothetical protein
MVRWYPADLIRLLASRYPPDKVHSIVVITKFPEAVTAGPLTPVLAAYEQVVVQVTVTGLGGSSLEARVPDPAAALEALPDLITFTGRPERVVVRIDPVIHWRGPEAGGAGAAWTAPWGETLRSNQPFFHEIAARARTAGVRTVKTSLASPYRKVGTRFTKAGLELVSVTGDRRQEVLSALESDAARADVDLEFCCEPSRPRSACIDAALLTRLHPRGLPARPERASGQREACGCSHAIDLAWYSTHPCPSGCLYCYANPATGDRLGEGGRP